MDGRWKMTRKHKVLLEFCLYVGCVAWGGYIIHPGLPLILFGSFGIGLQCFKLFLMGRDGGTVEDE